MDALGILQSVLAFVFVLGLLFICLWGIKFLQVKIPCCKAFQKLNVGQKVEVVWVKRIDARHMVFVLQKDNKEFFILSGNGQSLLLDVSEVKK